VTRRVINPVLARRNERNPVFPLSFCRLPIKLLAHGYSDLVVFVNILSCGSPTELRLCSNIRIGGKAVEGTNGFTTAIFGVMEDLEFRT
jgi:hypothetical protein